MEVVPPSYNLPRTPSTTVPGRFTQYMSGMAHFHNHNHNQSQNSMSYSQASSLRSSDSTNATSSSTLFNPPPPLPSSTPSNIGTPMNGPQESVLNRRGDKEASLFQICLNLRMRLRGLPGFDQALQEEEDDAGLDADPVTILWRFFRRGYPLMELYNSLEPRTPLEVDPTKVGEKKRGQAATFKFIQACMKELNINECFMILDLYGDDTTGFVKVTRVVNQVLDILVQKGILDPSYALNLNGDGLTGGQRTRRQFIVNELVTTERTYVQHLELLHAFKKLIEERGVISGDAVHDIFFNLNGLLDFQRRFLIRVEQTNILSEDEQNWGSLFVLYKDAFKVYEQYIANQNKCEKAAVREFDKLKDLGGPQELAQFTTDSTVLSAFLLKPFQRLAKYPLLLKELRDKGDLDPLRKSDIEAGIEAANSVLQATNLAVDKQERLEAMYELGERVEDWKGHNLHSFGELLLNGHYQVIKGDSSNPREQEREYKMYLFEMILLCCKEMNVNKPKNKMMGRQLVDKTGRARLQLKGRIFMQNVTDTVTSSKPGSYSLQIFWKGDPGVESFTIKFIQEDVMRKWSDQINAQRKIWRDSIRTSQRQDIRDDEFHFMQGQRLENPYQQQEEEEEDDLDGSALQSYQSYPDYPLGRNDSQTSLRSRSTTGESGPPMSRVAPRQFPMGAQAAVPPLQVRTNTPMSPEQGESFFSPATESPMSTRSSGTPSMYGYGRQQAPPIPGWTMDDHRFTAPAMPRSQINSMQAGSRVPQQRPSLPPSAHSASSSVNRLRSASSPDIANPVRRYDPSQVPPMPDMPQFPNNYAYAPGVLSRSQSSSPAQAMSALPTRSSTQTPTGQQQRLTLTRGNTPTHGDQYHQQQPMIQRQYSNATDHYGSPEVRMPTGSMGTPASLMPGIVPQPQLHDSMQQMALSSSGSPTQLKVRVHFESAGSSMLFVVPVGISFQSLKDRIDAKLQRSTTVSLASGQVKLKYADEGDLVSILSDEDVQMAFETWRDSNRGGATVGEVELYIQ